VSKSNALGKGFESLVPVNIQVGTVAAPKSERIHKLSIDTVVPKQGQPRKNFDDSALDQLAISIQQQGILQPIIVTQIDQNMYSIIAGERRWRAAKIVGLSEVPAIVRDVTEHEHLELSLLENVQRLDLNPMELAQTIYRLHNDFQQSYEEIAQRLGKAYTTVINSIRLLGLPEVMQESLISGNLTEGHARALLALSKNPDQQIKLFNLILTKKISVRQAEQFVVDYRNISKPKEQKSVVTESLKQQSAILTKALGQKVVIKQSKTGKGTITVNYKNESEFRILVEYLKKAR
jgi:ParB family chromosome partitioning protein